MSNQDSRLDNIPLSLSYLNSVGDWVNVPLPDKVCWVVSADNDLNEAGICFALNANNTDFEFVIPFSSLVTMVKAVVEDGPEFERVG